MTPPHTPRPNHPQDSVAADESTSAQIFGVMYITLTGYIDSMVPTSGPWTILGKLLSYIVKLAPILWWALPAGPVGRPPLSPQEPPTGCVPDTGAQCQVLLQARVRDALGQGSVHPISSPPKWEIASTIPHPPQDLSYPWRGYGEPL
ncbi:hypothetical protein DSO57_1022070 [Entomophthora muscae]|uniref:Uncharacterized protein n=1 Tax=Entomophthora muscae TaxID=34485 RepID=A0ACC2RUE3_9FUNG|nr:hypothetical protein DSO57_1022070 [Entomophthora muscae]